MLLERQQQFQPQSAAVQPTPQQLSNLIQVLKNQIAPNILAPVVASGAATNGARVIPPLMAANIPAPDSNSNSEDDSREGEGEQRRRVSRFSDVDPWEKKSSDERRGGSLSPIAQKITDYTLPPPPHNMPDMTRPPPGFDGVAEVECNPEDLIPKLPYFELPAGVMVPLIRLEDYNYKPLDSSEIKLPPMAPPGDRLMQAVEAFYALPSHERPRDGEGWEKLGLYEYFKVKNSARKQKDEEIAEGIREKSRSPSPINIDLLRPPKRKNKRVYRSRSRSPASPAARSRSNSPAAQQPAAQAPPQRPVSESKPPPPRRNSPNPPSRNRRSERERSLSPPSFAGATFTKSATDFIAESNKGHQMLMKMGWTGVGKGLGVTEQGIDAPIAAGDVREKQDQYKGVGAPTNQDPYESFRRNKANSFIHRIRARDNERT